MCCALTQLSGGLVSFSNKIQTESVAVSPPVSKWHYDSNTPKFLYADQIERLSVEEFKRWLAHLLQNPVLYSKSSKKHRWLSECACPFHNRAIPGNTRSRVEADILNHVDAMSRDRISVLSMGSGHLFQDLIILASLVQRGFRDVRISMVDVAWKKRGVVSFRSKLFQSIVKQLTKAYPGVKVCTAYSCDIGALPHDKEYDVVYAVDNDDFQASIDSSGSSRQQYQAQLDLMKAVSKLSRHSDAAFFVSQGHISLSVCAINQPRCNQAQRDFHLAIYYQYGVGQLMLDAMKGLLASRYVYIDRNSIKKNDEAALAVFAKRFNVRYEMTNSIPSAPFMHGGNLRGSLRIQPQVVDFFVKARFSGQYYTTYITMLLEYIQSRLGVQAIVKKEGRLDPVVESVRSVSNEGDDNQARNVLTPAISLLYKRLEKKSAVNNRCLTQEQLAQVKECISGCDRWLLRKGPVGSGLFMSSGRAKKRAQILNLKLALEDQSVSLGDVKKIYQSMRKLLVTHRSATCFHAEFPHSQLFVVAPVDRFISSVISV